MESRMFMNALVALSAAGLLAMMRTAKGCETDYSDAVGSALVVFAVLFVIQTMTTKCSPVMLNEPFTS